MQIAIISAQVVTAVLCGVVAWNIQFEGDAQYPRLGLLTFVGLKALFGVPCVALALTAALNIAALF